MNTISFAYAPFSSKKTKLVPLRVLFVFFLLFPFSCTIPSVCSDTQSKRKAREFSFESDFDTTEFSPLNYFLSIQSQIILFQLLFIEPSKSVINPHDWIDKISTVHLSRFFSVKSFTSLPSTKTSKELIRNVFSSHVSC